MPWPLWNLDSGYNGPRGWWTTISPYTLWALDSNFFFRGRINLFKVFLLIFLTPGTCSPVQIKSLISTELAYENFWGRTSICDFKILLLAESISCFISCLRHTKIQYIADFQPPNFGFTRVMTLYFSADVFLFTPFITIFMTTFALLTLGQMPYPYTIPTSDISGVSPV